jgi:hypothetical protein
VHTSLRVVTAWPLLKWAESKGWPCRESEATANLGAVLTGSTLVTMFVVRKLGLTLAELDDVTSGVTTTAEAKANVSAFGGAPTSDTAVAPAGGIAVENPKDL